jgi:hypothetical protein
MAELDNAFVVPLRDPGSNLGPDEKYFLIVFVAFEFKLVGCKLFNYLLILLIILLSHSLNDNMYVERDHLKVYFLNVWIQLTVF